MRELVYYVAVSLDGRIASPTHGFESFLSEGDHAEVLEPPSGATPFRSRSIGLSDSTCAGRLHLARF